MPYPNEHSARMIDADKFIEDSFRRMNNKFGDGIDPIFGKLKKPPKGEEGSMVLHTVRFDKNKFTVSEAKKWMKEHNYDYINFEPASEPADKSDSFDIERKSIEFKINSVDDEEDELYCGKFTGLASTYNNVDLGGDRIEKGAFADVISKANRTGKYPKGLIQHSQYDLGHVFTKMEDSEDGVKVEGKFLNTAKGRDLKIEVKSGAIGGMSIGYYVGDYMIENENSKNRVRVIKTIKDLPEISFVTFPMNPKATVLSAKSKPEDVRDFEHKLKELGFSQKEAKAIISVGYKGLNHCDDDLTQCEADLCNEIKSILKNIKKEK